MKLTLYPIASTRVSAPSSAPSPGSGTLSKRLSNAPVGHLHPPMKHDLPASYIAKPNLSITTQMKNLNLCPTHSRIGRNSIQLLTACFFLIASLFVTVDMFGQITHITGSPQTATSTTNVVAIAKPTTLQVGDIMIATISFSETTSNTDLDVDASATDWIVVDGFFSGDIGGADEIGITVLYKIATASDVLATNFSFTTDAASEDCMGSIVAFRGVDNASPFDVVGTFNDTESDDLLADPITTTLTNSAIFMTGYNNSSTETFGNWNTTNPGTLTELFDFGFAAAEPMALGGAWLVKPTAGSTGNGTAEMSGNSNNFNAAILIALNEVCNSGVDLELTKIANDNTPDYGSNVIFTLTVTNTGTSPANGVTVLDLLPAGLTYVTSSGTGSYNSGTGIWTIGTINNASNAIITIEATVNNCSSATITNSAQVQTTTECDVDSTPGDNSTSNDDDDAVVLTPTFPMPPTDLVLGDIAFTGYQSDGNSEFSIVLLTGITAGTQIVLTDLGWDNDEANGFRTDTDGDGVLLVTFCNDYDCGAEFHFIDGNEGNNANNWSVVDGTNSAAGIVTVQTAPTGDPDGIVLGTDGDQIFIFQGAPPTSANQTNFITGISFNGTGWNGDNDSDQNSERPDYFANNTGNDLGLADEDNGKYDCSPNIDDIITLRAAINNSSNWAQNTADVYDLSPTGFCGFSCQCTNPTIPTVVASPDPFCPGQTVVLTITGTLNDATQWVIYTGSCGGTLVGTTMTNSFMVNPAVTTTYFVRGEGGCITPGACGQGTATVNPNVPSCTTPVTPSDNATNVSLATNLDWQASTCVTGYKIYFGTNFPPTNIENGTTLGNVLTYNPASLNPNTVYNWRIVPYNANGDAVGCEDWQFTTGDGTPECTTPVFPFNGSTGLNPAGINLQWAPEPQATSYVLFFGTNNPPTNIVNGTNLGNVTTYATGALSMGTTYYWRIRPQNSFGDAGICSVWSFTTDLDGIVFCDDCTTPPTLPECADPGTNSNPDLSANCAEISIAFVLDESGSVSGNQADVENGTMNLLSALSCTGASVAMIEFNGYARYMVSDYEYVDDAYITAAQNYFDDTAVPFMNNQIYEPGGYPGNDQGTNWQAALLAVDELPFAPDLIIFLTDGIPTGYSTGANPTYNGPFSYCSSGASTQNPEIVNPIKLTNKFKGEGSHIFVVGVGNVTESSIWEISGLDEFELGVNNIGNSDYAVGSFAELSNGLTVLVSDLCPFESEVLSSDICEGSSNGSIIISVPSNLLPYNYDYFRNNVFIGGANGVNTTPLEISGLIAGNYRIELEVTLPGSGCTRTETFFDTINTGAPLLVSAVTTTTDPTCLDPNAGTATLTVTVGPPPYVITLKKGGILEPGYPDTVNVSPFVATGLDFGNYSFDVYNIDSCNIDINPFMLNEPTGCCPTSCTVTGGPGGNVCPATEAIFGVTTSGGTCTTPTYSWAIISNTSGASIVGSSTGASVTVSSGTTCGSYTIESTVTCSGCSPLLCTQVVNVVDNTQPTITTCAVTRNLEGCNTSVITGPNFSTTTTSSTEAVFENGTNQGVTSDNCAITSVTYIDVAVGTCPTVVTRTWTISDACGNTNTCNQTINVDDTGAPFITTCPVARVIEGCGTSSITGPDYSAVSASSTEAVFENGTNQGVTSDNCAVTSVTYIDVAVGTCPTVVTRTWTVSDACGNTNTCNQTITVDDTVMPTITTCAVTRNIEGCNTSAISGPAFSTVSAPSSEGEFENGTNLGVASDACGITSVTYIDVAVGVCPTVVTRTWTISDACGNVNTCNQTINVDDNTNPTIDCSGVNNLVLECMEGANYPTQIENWITAAKATILADPQTTDVCDATLVISDNYNGTDIPTLSCGQTSGLVVTFTVMDDCGNIATCNKTVYLDDNVNPTIDCSGVNDLVLVCMEGAGYAAQIEAWITAAKATILADPQTDDACDGTLSIVDDYNGSAVPTLSCNLTTGLTVTFTVSDECGNTAACTKTVYLDDNTNPTIDCSGVTDLVLECVNGANYTSQIEAWITAAKATILADAQTDDACDATLAIVDDYNGTDVPALSCGLLTGLTVTFTISDDCGNTAACTKTVYLDDETDPAIDCSGVNDLVLVCMEGANYTTQIAAWVTAAKATILADMQTVDACDATLVITDNYNGTDIPALSCTQSIGLIVTFTVTDDCGNAATCTKTVYLDDNTNPTIDCSGVTDLTLMCMDGADYAAQIEAWIAAAKITILADPQTDDSCDGTLAISDDYNGSAVPSFSCDMSSGLVVTFTVLDECGNTAACTKTVYLDDNGLPTIDCSGVNDLVLVCMEGAGYAAQIEAWITAAKATILADPQTDDACDGTLSIVDDYNGSAVPTLSCNLTTGLTVTFTVSDECGNTAACTKTVYLDDNTNPTIDCSGVTDLVLECVNGANYTSQIEAWITAAKATILADAQTDDACDATLAIVDDYNGTDVPALSCGLLTGLTVTFTISDDCGNTAACTKTVYLDDETDPAIDCSGVNDLVLVCMEGANYTTQIAAWVTAAKATILADMQTVDACDATLVITDNYNGTDIPALSCTQSIGLIVTFTVTDDCGNAATCTKTVYLDDNTNPTIDCSGVTDLTLMCMDGADYAAQIEAWIAAAKITILADPQTDDSCDGTLAISDDYNGSALPSFSCDLSSGLVVTFTVVDECGNTAACTKTVYLDDNTMPTIDCSGVNDLVLVCMEGAGYAAQIEAWITAAKATILADPQTDDACDASLSIVDDYNGTAVPTLSCNLTTGLTVTFTVSDECGNTAACTKTVYLDDNTNPTIDCSGVTDLVLECVNGANYASQIEAWITAAKATILADPQTDDACDGTLAIVDDYNGTDVPVLSCGLLTGLTVTFTVSDECGNTAACTKTVYLDDSTNPTIDCSNVTNLVMECADGANYVSQIEAWIAAAKLTILADPQTADACDVSLAISDDYNGIDVPALSCDLSAGLIVIFTVTDECGNTATCAKTVYVDDTTVPTIDCSGVNNLVMECADGSNYPAAIEAWIAAAKLTILADPQTDDACDATLAISDNYNGTDVPALSCDQTSGLTVVFTVTDECGNMATCAKTVYLDDTTLPTIDCSNVTNLVMECVDGANYPAQIEAWIAAAKLTILADPETDDACDASLAISDNYNGSDVPALSCDLTAGLTVVFTVTDECGNTATCAKTVYIDDTTLPTIDCSNVTNLVMECVDGADYPAQIEAWISAAKLTILADPQTDDACDISLAISDNYNGTDVPALSCDLSSGLTVVFTVTDECGNAATCAKTVYIDDTTVPTIDCSNVTNLVMECVDGANYPAQIEAWIAAAKLTILADPQTDDACDVSLAISDNYNGTDVPALSCDLTAGLTVVFTVTDECGNTATCAKTVYIDDAVAPVWDVNACTNIGMETINSDANCNAVMPDLRGDALLQLTENCDILTIADIIQSPAPGSPLTPPVGFDGCGPVGPVVYSVDVTFNVMDFCGNAAVELACDDLVKVQDVTAPTWDVDACTNIGMETINATADCGAVMPDLRGDALLELTENCDLLTVADIIQVPAPGTPLTPPVGFDGCGPVGPVVYTVDVTFNVTDCNGNAAVELACDDLVKVQDVTAPTWDVDACANIGMETINSDADCNAVMPDLRGDALTQLAENCDELTVADIIQVPAPGTPLTPPVGFDGCGPVGPVVYTVDVTFNVTDCNGNAAVELACDDLVKVQDVTAPTWDVDACTNIGMETINSDADCNAVMPDLRGDALTQLTENCDELTVADIIQVPAPGTPLTPPVGFDGCGPVGPVVYTVDVTFNVTDCNGNAAVELACDDLVKVQDVTAPTWDVDACANIGMETINSDADCNAVMPDLRGDALTQLTENCDELTVADIIQVPAPGTPLTPPVGFDGCGPVGPVVYTVDVTFNVTDCNGNAAVELACDDLVKVQDVTAPTWDVDACANIGMETINSDADCNAVMPDLRGDALTQLTENCDELTVADIIQVPAPGTPLTPPVGFDGCGPVGPVVYTVDVTFNVTDCNGNAAVELACDDLVKVQDVTAPTWDVDACTNIGMETINSDADCNAVMPDLRGDALTQLTENCDELTVADIIQVPAPGTPLTPPVGFDGCGPVGPVVYTVDVTFNVTDCNGNAAVELACDDLVKVQDVTAPTWDVDACANIGMETINSDADCNAVMPDLRGDALTQLTENCDELTVADIIQVPTPGTPLTPPVGFDGCGPVGPVVYTVDVTFNVTDCNGNAAVELACDDLVKVQDVTAPTWDVDACANIGMETINSDVDCNAVMPDLRGDALTQLTENCDELTVADIIQVPAPGTPLTPPVGFDGCGPVGPVVYTVDVTFNVTDCNGNAAVELACDDLVKVQDVTAPTWDVDACTNIGMETINSDADCNAVMPDLRGDALTQLTENCDELTVADILQVPAPGTPLTPPVGFDGCGPVGSVVYTVDVTFNVTDCNGNAAVELACDDLVKVQDVTAPTWDVDACANIGMETINSDADCNAVMPDLRGDALTQLTENCDELTVADIIQVPAPGTPLTPPVGFDGCGPVGPVVYTVDVTFNVTDCNGNAAVELACDDLVKVQDVTAPTWDVDACANIGMETINSDADCNAVMPDLRGDALTQLTENCDELTVADIIQVPAPGTPLTPPVGFDGCGPVGPVVYTVDVTFNVTDCNGNAAVELACDDLVKVQDVTAPTWDVDACANIGMETINSDADCNAVMPDLRGDALTQLTENCDELTVADIIQVPAPGTPLTPPVGFDGCGPVGPVVYTVDVTFNVTDCNGNAAVELACDDLVKVQDVTAPTWDVDACANIGMETINSDADCNAVMPDLRGDALTQLTENCDELTVADIIQVPAPGTPLTPPVGFDGCGPVGPVVYTVDVTFNVTDCNGNAAVELACDDLVKVQDVTAPTWDVDACANIGMETINSDADCNAVMPDLRGDALTQLTENCDELTVADIIQVPAPGTPLTPPVGFDGCGPVGPVVYTVDVTFNVTDCNGNAAVELACDDLVKVQDVTAPTWDVDACANIGMETINSDADCNAVMPDLRGDALTQLTENCDELTVADIIQVPAPGTPLTPPVGFDGCGPVGPVVYTVDVTFNVTDCNGNAAVELACDDLVKVQDVTAPTWDVDACTNIGMETINATADCGAVMPDLREDALMQLTENCDQLTVADIIQVPAPGSPLIPPVGFDGCGPVGPVVYTVDVTFNVTDCNGNAAVELACDDLVKVQDVTAPTWSTTACENIGMEIVNADANCDAVMPDLRADALAQLTENCDVLTVADIIQVPAPGTLLTPPMGFDGCGPIGSVVYTVDVTFNVTDCNGNAAVELACDDLVKVQDVTGPTWNVDACTNIGMEIVNADANCDAIMPDLRADALSQLTENCDNLTISDIDQFPAPGSFLAPPVGFDGCGPNGAIVYAIDVLFNVTDCNGNMAAQLSCDDLVKVQDVTAPTWDANACTNIGMEIVNADANCDAIMPDLRADALSQLTENCDNLTVTDIDQFPAPGSYLAPPVGFDGCGPNGPIVYPVDVLFNVTDCNGNMAAQLSCDDLVKVQDVTAPTWDANACTNIGMEILSANEDCEAVMPDLRPDALLQLTENCDVLTATDIIQVPAPGSVLTPPPGFTGCGPNGPVAYAIDVTFNVTDCNGNVALELSCEDLVKVEDTTPPIILTPMGSLDTLLDCDDIVGINLALSLIPAATDNCDPTPTISLLSDDTIQGSCAQEYTRTRVWNFKDDCGNISDSFTQTITVQDTLAPTIDCSGVNNLVMECVTGANYPAQIEAWIAAAKLTILADPQTDDACDMDLTVVDNYNGIDVPPLSCNLSTGLIVMFTVSDDCGNTATCTKMVYLDDTMQPMITCPADTLTLECDADGDFTIIGNMLIADWLASATATDACSDAVVTHNYSPTGYSDGCGATGVQIVTFTATDDCDNASTCTAVIEILDTVDPMITCPADTLTLECDADGDFTVMGNTLIADWLASATATDACSDAVVTHNYSPTGYSDGCGATGVQIVTFTATDDCDNTSTCTAVIEILDTVDPMITCPADTLTLECDADGDFTVLGNTLIANWLASATATDACSTPVVTNSYSPTGYSDGCGATGVQIVTFTATDDCDNTSTCTAVIEILDTVDPMITCPADTLTLECDADGDFTVLGNTLIANWLASATATDACSTPVVTNSYSPSGYSNGCGATGVQIVTFTATDACNNTSTCTAVIEILDTIDPVITCPTDTLTLECDSDGDFSATGNTLIAAWLGSATATDACSGAGVTNNYNPLGYSNGCGATGMQTVTFTATDSCGNTSTCQAVIEILDTIDPTITCPADTLTLECDSEGDFTILGNQLIAAWLGSATATDACSGAGVTNDYNPDGYSNGCGATGMQTVTFTATDSCGNTSTCQAVIEILDTVDPTITCPADTLTLECDSDGDFSATGNMLIANWLATATATDACSGAGVTNNYSPTGYSNGCGATGLQTVTFTATDSCGNTSTCQAVIEILDTVDPTLTCPADTLTLECDSDGDFSATGNTLIAAWLGSATATDACSGAGVTNNYNPMGYSNGCGATGMQTVTFTATDSCGNTSTCQAVIEILDTVDPTITCPLDTLTLECDADGDFSATGNTLIAAWLGSATATDACSGAGVTNNYNPMGYSNGCGATGMQTVTFTATDSCGNTSTCQAVIEILDTIDPTIMCPADTLTLECDSDGDFTIVGNSLIAAWLGSATATDACSGAGVTNNYNPLGYSNGCGATGMQTVTFTATDSCGNTSTCQAVIEILDTVDPTITCPADTLTLECDADGDFTILGNSLIAAWLGSATATDACSGAGVTNNYNPLGYSNGCGATGMQTVTFTATDSCGNTSTCQAVIEILDTVDPTITCPADTLTLECDSEGDFTILGNSLIAAWLGSATATDACSGAGVTNDYNPDGFSNGCGATGLQTVTFTATDSCGNTSTCQAVIEILDTVDPVITCPADTLTLECDSEGDFTILGNQLIAAWLGSATATDACSGAGVTNNYNPDGYSNGCGATGLQTVTFTATDSCGNTSTCQAVIEILDTVDPTITCPADTLTLECDFDGDFSATGNTLIAAWLGSATATDACSGAAVTNNYSPTGYSNGCGATGMQTVTFTATDSCGNTSTCQAVIEILDTIDPTLTCPADTLTLECDSDGDFSATGNTLIAAWLGSATATDACSGAGVTNNYNPLGYSNGCGATGMQTVTFTATDSCGNTSTCQAVIEILDTIDPTLTCPADTLTLECDADGDFTVLGNQLIAAWLGSATATDACSGAGVTNNYNPTGYSDGCGETGMQTVTFTATDSCGNTSTCQAVIEIRDTTIPDITCPMNVTIECDDSILPDNTGMASATDNCDSAPTVTYDDSIAPSQNCIQEYTITRTWLATDDCGNTSTCTQVIVVDDRTAPVITFCPANVTIECTDDPSYESNGYPSATDNCSVPAIDFDDVTIDGECGPNYTIQRTWIATDDCGNTSTCLQVISVEDNTPPVCATQDISITEIIDPATGVIHFTAEMINNGSTDNCGGPVTLSIFPDSLACEDEGPNIVTLTVTDECGNSSTCTAIVTIDCIDPCVKVASWVYLEGAATDPNGLPNAYTIPMRTSLNDLQVLPGQTLVDPFFGNKYTPAGQPYSIAPWNYPGTEGNLFDSGGNPMMGDAGYPPSVVDWVLVSLRADSAGTGGPVCQAAALLHNDGHIEFVEEFDCCNLDLYATYFIVIEHRNHLIVMSHDSLPIDLNNSTITYDFRLQQSYLDDPFAFGAFAQKEIQPGVFAMFAGNGDQTTSLQSDTDINFDDRTFWEGENGDIGEYRFGDYNLNGDTNFNDRLTWERNNGNFTSVPRD